MPQKQQQGISCSRKIEALPIHRIWVSWMTLRLHICFNYWQDFLIFVQRKLMFWGKRIKKVLHGFFTCLLHHKHYSYGKKIHQLRLWQTRQKYRLQNAMTKLYSRKWPRTDRPVFHTHIYIKHAMVKFKCQFDPPVNFTCWSAKFSFPRHSGYCPCFFEVFNDFKKDKPSDATCWRTRFSLIDLTTWHAESCNQVKAMEP